MNHPFVIGEMVTVRSEHFSETCSGVIVDISRDSEDQHWFYEIEVMSGDRLDAHRNEAGELWLNDFEVFCES